MNKIARFEKVSYEQFKKDWIDTFKDANETTIKDIYDKIILPKRATRGSAGYDFMCPRRVYLEPRDTIKIPTGIRCYIEDGWVLQTFPRSSLGFKYRMQLNNTVGIIDSDYYCSDNEGHIFVKFTNDSNENKDIELNEGDNFVQGIFLPFGLTYDDNTEGVRNGGLGSTGRK